MPGFFFISRHLLSGKTLVRTVLDYRLQSETLQGKVLDLGSGGSDQYTKFIPRDDSVEIVHIDQKRGDVTDFEKDRLPVEDGAIDTILFLNVLEHIYNHRHILNEIRRIKKDEGRLIGFVPFLKWYHADPHDYFRYTHETLEKLLQEAGYTHITVVPLYLGPYSTAFDMILPTLPKFIRPILYVPCYLIDMLFRRVRRNSARRYALGYYFIAV